METHSDQQLSTIKDLSIQPESIEDLNFTPLERMLNNFQDVQKQEEIRSILHDETSETESQKILEDTTTKMNNNTLANMGKLMAVAEEVMQEDKSKQMEPEKEKNFFKSVADFFRRLFTRKKAYPSTT